MLKTDSFFKKQFRRRAIQFLILLTVSLVANHLTSAEHFPLHESYRFPLYGILTSMFLGTLILIITELIYSYFLRHIFKENITLRLALHFLFACLGIITLLYIPIFYVAGKIEDADFDLYALTIGLLITLALCAIFITAVYAVEIYNLYKNQLEQGTLLIKNGNRKKVVRIKEISYGYTVHKIVYLVEENGTINATDFTLQKLESTLEAYGFFRASRNILLHARAVKETKAIENGKLSVVIQPVFLEQEQLESVVSRYKKKDFMMWFENSTPILPTIEE